MHNGYVMNQTNHYMPSFVVLQNLCLFCLVHWKLWVATGGELNVNVRGTHFLRHYYVLRFIRTFGQNVHHWIKFTVAPWNVVSILCLSFVIHDEIDFILSILLMGNKRWQFFFIICMLQTWLLRIICIHGIGCTAMGDISFWNKKMFLQINKYINTACLGDVALIFSNSLKKRVMFALSLSLNIETPAKSTINLVWHEKEFGK